MIFNFILQGWFFPQEVQSLLGRVYKPGNAKIAI